VFQISDFLRAKEKICDYIVETRLRKSEWLSKELNANVYLKFECFQPGGSFKIRGASNALLSQQILPNRVITASGGNHGIGVAIISKKLSIPCLIVLPESTSKHRINILENLGAETKIKGRTWDESNVYASQLAAKSGSLYIHPFSDPLVLQGQGTIILEVLEEVNVIDSVIASIGGGGLLTGVSLAIDAMGLAEKISIYGVETIGAECFNKSLVNGTLTELDDITSIATSLGAKKMNKFNFTTLTRMITQSYTVSDRDTVSALIDFLNYEKVMIEPAASCIIAALLQNKGAFTGKNIVLIICGSNVSFEEVGSWKFQFLG